MFDATLSYTNNDTYYIRDAVIDQLISFSYLKDGWDCGTGTGISDAVIIRSLSLYNNLFDPIFEYECTPISNNSIQLTFCLKNHFLDLVISENQVDVTYEKGIGYDFTTEIQLQNVSIYIIKKLLSFIKEQCFSLEQSIFLDIAEKKEGLKNVSQSWVTESPSFLMTVQSSNRPPFVLT